MNREFFISVVIDKRREKKNGKYPVKLRVFTKEPRKQVLYPTKFEFDEHEFNVIRDGKKLTKEQKESKLLLNAIEAKAEDEANKLEYFTFEAFEKALFNKHGRNNNNLISYYENAIEQYKLNRQIGTASNYEYSLKSLTDFHNNQNLNFSDITVQWLNDYENYLISNGKSLTTVGMYLRPLRAIFNNAIADKKIKAEQYPFGKRKYTIPAPKGIKKALSKEQLKSLFHTEPNTPEQKRAKAFWFFSYSCNGMNFKDIANLKYKDIDGDIITFRRAKTANTNKKQAPVIVYLNDFSKSVIIEYGNQNDNPETYVFPILNSSLNYEEQHNKLKLFIRSINQGFEKFAPLAGINEKVSTYWARHSFATNAIRNGASLEFVSEALSHSNLKTTIGYFAGFEDEKKREISKSLMDF